MRPPKVHPLLKNTPTNHLIQVVDAPIKGSFYHILHSQPDEAFLKEVDAGKKMGFACVNNVWTLYACGKNKRNRFTAILDENVQVMTLGHLENFDTVAKKYPSRNIGIQNRADKTTLESIADHVACKATLREKLIKESDFSNPTVKILVCNAQHPDFSTTSEPEAVYSRRFYQLIRIIEKVKGPVIYTFSEVHPAMEKLIKLYFDQVNYHIVKQTYDQDLKVSLVTVLNKQAVSKVDRSTDMRVPSHVQSLLCTLANTNEQFMLHAVHLPHQGNNIDRAEKIIINGIFSNTAFSLYPQILTGDLNITLQAQDDIERNIATSVAPETTINKSPPLFNGKPTYRWNRTLGTLTLPRLREDAESPSRNLDFYSKMQLIDVESHHSINPEDSSIYSPPKETPSALIGEFRLFSRFGKKYREDLIPAFYKKSFDTFYAHMNVYERFLPQAQSDVAVYQSGDQDNANFELVFNISNGMWNKLKLFLDTDRFQCRYFIQYDKPDQQVLERMITGKQIFLARDDNFWYLLDSDNLETYSSTPILEYADIDVLNDLAEKYPSNNNEIQDDIDKAALEKIVTSHGGITRQIEAVEHPESTFLICRAPTQHRGEAVVEAMTSLMDEKYQQYFTLENEVAKQNCRCEWIKEKDVFYIQFSFAARGHLIAHYLKEFFKTDGGEVVEGDKFKIPMDKIKKNMAGRIKFSIGTAASIAYINSQCHGLLTIVFNPGMYFENTGHFNIIFCSKTIAHIIFRRLYLHLKNELNENTNLGSVLKTLSMDISDNIFSTEPERVKQILSKTLVDSIAGIVNNIPCKITPSLTEIGDIFSQEALPHKLIQRFNLTQKHTCKFFYTPAPGSSYAGIVASLHQDTVNLMNKILKELKNYTGEDTAYKKLQSIAKSLLPLPQLTILHAHCQKKINSSKDTSNASFLWSAPKSDKHTDLLHKSLIQANFLANLEFNYLAKSDIKTLQQLINTQERRELVALCIEERKHDGETPYIKVRKNSALLLLENYLILMHPEYKAHDVWDNINSKPVKYHGTGKNYPRESDGEDLTLGEILKPVKKIWNALSSLVTSNDVTTHIMEARNK